MNLNSLTLEGLSNAVAHDVNQVARLEDVLKLQTL